MSKKFSFDVFNFFSVKMLCRFKLLLISLIVILILNILKNFITFECSRQNRSSLVVDLDTLNSTTFSNNFNKNTALNITNNTNKINTIKIKTKATKSKKLKKNKSKEPIKQKFELLTTLNGFRIINSEELDSQNKVNLSYLKSFFKSRIDGFEIENNQLHEEYNDSVKDYFFNKNSLYDLVNTNKRNSKSNFYSSNFILNNEKACNVDLTPDNKNSNDEIIILCLIHTHKKNYLRRQTMRETWLNQSNLHLNDLINMKEFSLINNKSKS